MAIDVRATNKALAFLFAAWLGIVSAAAAGERSADIAYAASFSGFKVAEGALTIRTAGSSYFADANISPAAFGWLFSSGGGGAQASGRVFGDRLRPARYRMTSTGGRHTFLVELAMVSNRVREAYVTPRFKPNPERIAVEEKHRRRVLDPLSAAVFPQRKGAQKLGPEACRRILPIYDGWARYDLNLSFAQHRNVDEAGYRGPVVVCRARWAPIAGHIPSRPSVKFMKNNEDMFVWLAPMGDGQILFPFRIEAQTRSGRLVIQATQVVLDGAPGDRARHAEATAAEGSTAERRERR